MKFASDMAAAILHPLHHGSHSHSEAANISDMSLSQEQEFVAHCAEDQSVMAPEQIDDERSKEIGHASRSLGVKDFELVRTLGTGAYVEEDGKGKRRSWREG